MTIPKQVILIDVVRAQTKLGLLYRLYMNSDIKNEIKKMKRKDSTAQ